MDFNEKRKQQLGIKSLGDLIRSGKVKTKKDPAKFVYGPDEFDCLNDRWSRGEVLGIIGPSGSGKTELTLNFFRDMLKRNATGVVVFVSLEMSNQKIAERWIRLAGEDEDLVDRLFIISNFDDEGRAKCLTTAGILNELKIIKSITGDNIIAFAIDHLHIIQPSSGEDLNRICQKVKDMAIESDSFAILISQTTKEKSGLGDTPLDASSSYGCSQFQWIASYVITIHSPLTRVKAECGLNILSWGYYKVREQHKNDKVKVAENRLLSYDIDTGNLRKLTNSEKLEFQHWYEKVLMLRENEEKHKSYNYNLSDDKVKKEEDAV